MTFCNVLKVLEIHIVGEGFKPSLTHIDLLEPIKFDNPLNKIHHNHNLFNPTICKTLNKSPLENHK